MTPVRTVARALLGAVFVYSGAQVVQNPDRVVAKAKTVTDKVAPLIAKASPKLPTDARTLVQVNGAVQIVGGLMLLTPLRRLGAVALAGSLVPTTLAGHPFWHIDDPVERAQHRTHFLKNLGLMGGALLAAADNDGAPGLRWRANRLATDTSAALHRAAGNTRSKAKIARKSAKLGRQSATFGRHLID
jgi:putative oxidoreductase